MKKKQPLMATAAGEAASAAAVGYARFTDGLFFAGSALAQVGEMSLNGLATVGGVVKDVITADGIDNEALMEARAQVESCALVDGGEARRLFSAGVDPMPALPPEVPLPQQALPLAAAAAEVQRRKKQQRQQQQKQQQEQEQRRRAHGAQGGAQAGGCMACTSGLCSIAGKALRSLGCLPGTEALAAEEMRRQESDDNTASWEDVSEKSRLTMQRHQDEADWSPTVLLYDASMDPPPEPGSQRTRLRRAYYMPLNGLQPCLIENENFSGSFLFMHRSVKGDVPKESAYQWHFDQKTRRWEARVQGRFRHVPRGELYTGCILEDFDYSLPQSWSASMLAYAVVPLMEAVVGETFYFRWGERGEAAEQADAELATIVTWLSGVDQVIVTPAGETPPPISSDIAEMGLRRNAMSAAAYHKGVQQVVKEIDTEKTYTFCVWGCSRYIDVMKTAFDGVMGLGSISYAGFLDEWPAHFVLYSVEGTTDSDPRHLERRKRYFVDVMVWSSMMELPKLPSRYNFCDQRFAAPKPEGRRQQCPADTGAGRASPVRRDSNGGRP